MMKKGLTLIQQQQQPVVLEENMSNLTSASGDHQASVSSGQHYFSPPPNQTQPALKKKRNLPGNPDPEAEVIALSPKTLMATNRFICEICNKGFQRDQNLQLHRRGHNLPWKLKQRTSKEVRKKVFVCPEDGCVHHDPSRALGDLTGIKKHFCRKHGEKKWKCDKCSKRYAVQSDWKAHSKTCGSREYRCDCGTLFSRRDSFITHRAFCDALAQESARASSGYPLLSSQQASANSTPHMINLQPHFMSNHDLHAFSMKKEQQNFSPRAEVLPPWLAGGPPPHMDLTSSIFTTRSLDQEFTPTQDLRVLNQNPNPNPNLGPSLPPYHPTGIPHMSATALLQKATQMGATMSSNITCSPHSQAMMRPHQGQHMSAGSGNNTTGFGLNLSSCEENMTSGVVHGLAPFGNKAASIAGPTGASGSGSGAPPSLLQDMMMNSLSSANIHHFDGSSFDDDAFGDILNSKKDGGFHETLSKTTTHHHFGRAEEGGGNGGGGGGNGGGGGGGNDGMTRDFLGLRPLSHSDILKITGFGNCMSSPHENGNDQSQKSWQG
ncbi:protein indeterminate-domain 7-like [Cornus florida]|uniref:protein indeterminate-domain 7-like n=1 Tax=Cornus florida TaxID=4283 RepID=UPI002898E8D9|nr:protein indeterminate-domain 7-like [Cornus florida]XP_059641675.1 protein indeterminate-domain 7-like [Cornus florida]XP_059641676.1 protein indeterminate-domain 7-like [Cornus florida]